MDLYLKISFLMRSQQCKILHFKLYIIHNSTSFWIKHVWILDHSSYNFLDAFYVWNPWLCAASYRTTISLEQFLPTFLNFLNFKSCEWLSTCSLFVPWWFVGTVDKYIPNKIWFPIYLTLSITRFDVYMLLCCLSVTGNVDSTQM